MLVKRVGSGSAGQVGALGIWFLSALILASVPQSAQALIIEVQSVTVDASGAAPVESFFNLFLRLEAAETAPNVAAFSGAVDLSPTARGIILLPPFAELQAPSLITTDFVSSGNEGRAKGSADLPANPGTTPGTDGSILFRVPFRVSPGTDGVFAVIIDLNEFSGTLLVDGEGDPIRFTAVDGTITSVPEPISLALLGLAMGLLSVIRSRRGAPSP